MLYALVTGCDHGLGPALARGLLRRGFTVLACRLNPDEHEIEALSRDFPDTCHVLEVDIGKDASVEELKEEAAKRVPCLDLLVNCAGILGVMEDGPGEPLDYDLMAEVINVNALGALRMTAALLPMVERSQLRTVVNISSEAGSIRDCERTGWFGYCMSKAANNMQGALIHNTMRLKGGQVIQMHPGHVATYMRGHLDTTARLTPEASAQRVLQTVLDRELPVRDRPLYLDDSGKELPW